jgi:hypothetical protein
MEFEELELEVGWCAGCRRDVLLHSDYEPQEQPQRFCVHCDSPVTENLRVASGEELADEYGLLEDLGCGRPDCGRGRCGRS